MVHPAGLCGGVRACPEVQNSVRSTGLLTYLWNETTLTYLTFISLNAILL